MDKPGGIILSGISQTQKEKKKSMVILGVESEKVKYVKEESGTVVTKDGKVGGMRGSWSKGTKLQL